MRALNLSPQWKAILKNLDQVIYIPRFHLLFLMQYKDNQDGKRDEGQKYKQQGRPHQIGNEGSTQKRSPRKDLENHQ